jgi:hypothetical protein
MENNNYTYIYIYMYIYVCIYVYICVYVYVYIYVCVYMYMCVYVYVCIYIKVWEALTKEGPPLENMIFQMISARKFIYFLLINISEKTRPTLRVASHTSQELKMK